MVTIANQANDRTRATRLRAALRVGSAVALLGAAGACDTARDAAPAAPASATIEGRAGASSTPAPGDLSAQLNAASSEDSDLQAQLRTVHEKQGANGVAPEAPRAVASGPIEPGKSGPKGATARRAFAMGAARACNCTPGDPLCSCLGGSLGVIGHGAGGGGMAAPAAKAVAPSATAPAAMWGLIDQPAPAPVAARPLDPNARYATTYRPGGAALAAFDAAVSRGQIPTTYKDLVGDFGARYAPAVAAPTEGALTVSVDTERAAVGPDGGATNLVVSLASSDAMPSRAPLSVHIVLDISGSMSGQAIEDAKHAAEAAVDKLDPGDDFSMVTFSNEAQVLVADGPIGPRRDQVLARIQGVHADGGTNISSGLDLGYAEARAPAAGDEAVRIVMLLSDGHANAGDTDPGRLADRAARAFQDGIQTSSFGLGPDYDAPLMSGIADRGAGGYYYLADSSQIAPALAREIDARLRPVATAVELRVRLRPDVSATRVFGSRELSAAEADAVRSQEVAVDQHEQRHGITADRQIDATGGMRFFIPAFARADRHATMLSLQLPPGVGERSIASVEVRYKDRLLKKNVTSELAVKMRWAASDAESAATSNPTVQRMEQAFGAGDAILEAAERVDHGDRGAARSVLNERAAVMRMAAAVLAEPRLVEDAGRLDRLADAVGGAQPLADALPLVVMLRGSGYGYL
jgi:Ca-activated chloride channel family protein